MTLKQISFKATTFTDMSRRSVLAHPMTISTERMAYRALDLLMATTALALALPVMLLIAIAIKLESRGPVFHTSRCKGTTGNAYTRFRLRSMVINAESLQLTNYIDNEATDPRITHVGKFLRETHLDELPQLLNIVRGELSFFAR
jgi:lipopolysaccharide/colanic/teichoic acid biosynthesis glycosyltransferase